MLNTFRLGVQPSAYYLGLFDEHAIKLTDTGYPDRFFEFPFAVATIGVDENDPQFDIIFIVKDGLVPAASIATAKEILAQIVEMDDAARSLEPYVQGGKAIDHDEVLARVVVLGDEVRFRYFATTVNTEWDVLSERQPSGNWVCRGIQPPRGRVRS